MTDLPESGATPDHPNPPAPPDPYAPPSASWPVQQGSPPPGQPGFYPPVTPVPHHYAAIPYGVAPTYGYAGQPPVQPVRSGMYLAAAIINWVVLGLVILATCGLGIIAAAWFVPMTVFIHKGVADGRRHTALAVCTLIFCNLISGVLMLVDDSNRPA